MTGGTRAVHSVSDLVQHDVAQRRLRPSLNAARLVLDGDVQAAVASAAHNTDAPCHLCGRIRCSSQAKTGKMRQSQ